MPAIHLTNIGKGDGATPTEMAAKVIGAITNEATKVASLALTKQTESAVGAQIPTDAKSVGDQVKVLLSR